MDSGSLEGVFVSFRAESVAFTCNCYLQNLTNLDSDQREITKLRHATTPRIDSFSSQGAGPPRSLLGWDQTYWFGEERT